MTVEIEDKQIYGNTTDWLAVSAEACPDRRLLKSARECNWLNQYKIGHVGVMSASYPYEVNRNNQSGSFMMACLGGRGEVLVDGRWIILEEGNACLLAPHVANNIRCMEGEKWKFAWVRYEEPEGVKSIADNRSPVRGKYASESLERCVMGLYHELEGENGDKALEILWSELIHRSVLKFAKPKGMDERLWRIWNDVSTDLSHPWTLGELADIGCVSEEHLRRLCRKDLGRSPMQHLIYLRMIKAREILISGDDKVDYVAKQVGYESGFTFSNTFKKWMGCRPSELREIC